MGFASLTSDDLLTLSREALSERVPSGNAIDFDSSRTVYLTNIERNALGTNEQFDNARQLSKSLKKNIFSLTESEFLQSSVPNYGSSQLFQQSFSRLFVEYRDLLLRNDLIQLAFQNGVGDSPALSAKEFVEKHGPAPWDFVNSSLDEAGLDFSINAPSRYEFGSFQPVLTKTSTRDLVNFQNLSSGEKIIMSFAFCLYYATDNRQLASYPKLLLLDEVDAPLHPSMTKSLIRTIQTVLCEKYDIGVILATHSPSTAALSPSDSLCVMVDGNVGLKRTSKSEALNFLTEGVPTLSLIFSGRRQVFVESNADAETYSSLYTVIGKALLPECSLEFISTGVKDAVGVDRNTGCSIVKKLVRDISGEGNTSIFGIVDWDGVHKRDGRVFVLAENKRNGLENVILDPLLVSACIARDFPSERAKIGLPSDLSYMALSKWGVDKLQPVVDLVCSSVLGKAPTATVSCNYISGMRLQVESDYLTMDDHDLEGRVLSAFPSLKGLGKGQAGRTMKKIIETVVADLPGWMPTEARDLFQQILSAKAH
ncbi:MAG: AAA family ATPase [Janthinobacterium lividum]